MPPRRDAGSFFIPRLGVLAVSCAGLLLVAAVSCAGLPAARAAPGPAPLTGYVVHFNFVSNASDARQLVKIAAQAGAKVISVVPPSRVWKSRPAMEVLDAILDEISRRKLSFVFTRIDGAYPPDARGQRYSYLYGRILTRPGILPNGSPTNSEFLTNVGLKDYDNWMEEETRYYARRFGRMPNLIGFNVGPFSEPLSAERCAFLHFLRSTGRYEITQYTPQAAKLWHRWLAAHFGNLRAVNLEYGSSFSSLNRVPLPRNESDRRFGKPELAYFDFIRVLNDWFLERYDKCRRIWHEVSGRADVPLILQFNGADLEKFVKGRPSDAALDLPGWLANADAVGLSLYTNSGYPDFAHASVKAAVRLAALAKDQGKDVFVLEGGCEAPNVVLSPRELEFFGTVALPLHPRTYIYEFLKDKFDETYPTNPGKLVTAEGEIRQPAFHALRSLFARIASANVEPDAPALYAISDPLASRGNLAAGALSAALYDLASDVSIRWVPRGADIKLRPGVPVIRLDGSVYPANERLSRLLKSIPAIDSPERTQWREEVLGVLRGAR